MNVLQEILLGNECLTMCKVIQINNVSSNLQFCKFFLGRKGVVAFAGIVIIFIA